MKTAVEWLIELLAKEKIAIPDYIINKAKEMEKQQIMQSLNDGKAMAIGNLENKTLEQYYNKTFNNED